MALFDLLGPTAMSIAVEFSYGSAPNHGAAFWTALLVGVIAGITVTIAMCRFARHVADAEGPQVNRRLGLLYVATFGSVLAVTLLCAKGMLWGLAA